MRLSFLHILNNNNKQSEAKAISRNNKLNFKYFNYKEFQHFS